MSTFLLLLACQPPSPSDSGSTKPAPEAPPRLLENGLHTLAYDGADREFILYVPPELPVGAPLVVVMHGYSDSAGAIRRYSAMDAVADRERFAVVYPQGLIDSYGFSYWEVGYAFHDGSVDDVGFLLALRARVVADQGLNPDAVFATGMSNGGDMSYRLACEAAGAFRAVAPVAGCLMGWLEASCAPMPEVPLFEIHGTLDPITPWEGDVDGSDGYGPYLGTEASVGHFVTAYGLDVEATEPILDTNTTDGSNVIAHRWSRPDTSTEVWLYEIEGGHHDWPDSFGNKDISAEDEIWSFFARYVGEGAQ